MTVEPEPAGSTAEEERTRLLAVLDERDRIGQGLQDVVIDRLFATGMLLAGAAELIDGDPARAAERVRSAVEALDETIREVRASVYDLRFGPRPAGPHLTAVGRPR